jgi:hypothetical protein
MVERQNEAALSRNRVRGLADLIAHSPMPSFVDNPLGPAPRLHLPRATQPQNGQDTQVRALSSEARRIIADAPLLREVLRLVCWSERQLLCEIAAEVDDRLFGYLSGRAWQEPGARIVPGAIPRAPHTFTADRCPVCDNLIPYPGEGRPKDTCGRDYCVTTYRLKRKAEKRRSQQRAQPLEKKFCIICAAEIAYLYKSRNICFRAECRRERDRRWHRNKWDSQKAQKAGGRPLHCFVCRICGKPGYSTAHNTRVHPGDCDRERRRLCAQEKRAREKAAQ